MAHSRASTVRSTDPIAPIERMTAHDHT